MASIILPDKDAWVADFMSSNRLEVIKAAIANLRFSQQVLYDGQAISPGSDIMLTPRENQLATARIDLQAFYILDFISNQIGADGKIYDIGCGSNFFKQFYNVIGIDPLHPAADINDFFDEDFAGSKKETMPAAIGICSIHFCKLHEIEQRLTDFINLLKPRGWAYVALNFARILDRERLVNITSMDFVLQSKKKIDEIVANIPHNVVLYENVMDKNLDDGVNGNIRILVQRVNNERV